MTEHGRAGGSDKGDNVIRDNPEREDFVFTYRSYLSKIPT